jgi:hypothetical protein
LAVEVRAGGGGKDLCNQEEHWRPRQVRYLIAFKDNVIQWADAYWVSANILYYETPVPCGIT